MKSQPITRRQFLKLNVFGVTAVAAASLVSIAAPAPEQALADATAANRVLPQPTFSAIPSTLMLGKPAADLSMGWDGTVWAIDTSGAPHLFDPQQQQWNVHGDGLDAAAWIGSTYYWFKGDECVTAPFGGSISAIQKIGTAWLNLPDSFKLGLTGAANVAGNLIFFRGGWYLPADGPQARQKLIDLVNWPQTDEWAAGVIDAVHSDGSETVMFLRGDEFILANLQTQTVTASPAPLSSYVPWQNRMPMGWAATGIDAAFTQAGNVVLYNGPMVAGFSAANTVPVTPEYIGAVNTNWPATWHPVLNHAPSGRVGNLWAATQSGGAVQHDGDTWIARDIAGNGVISVASGGDGSTYLCGSSAGRLWQWFNGQWQILATHSAGLSQVAAGGAGHVWVRDVNNGVHRFDPLKGLVAVSLGAGIPAPTHIAANADGTLWHCNSANANAFRLISEATAASAGVPIKPGITTAVQKVASTGFGAAHCLAQQADGSSLIYKYDSPYMFKTAAPYTLLGTSPMAQGLGRLYFVQLTQLNGNRDMAVRIVSLDAHTGVETASMTPASSALEYTGIVFDPVHELIYFGTAVLGDPYNNAAPGQLIALDARTLAVQWTFQTATGLDATPALNGTQLCVGDRTNALYMFDTSAVLAASKQGQPITPKWKVATGFSGGQTGRVSTPLISNGRIYGMVWDVTAQYQGSVTNVGGIFTCDAASGGNMAAHVLGTDGNVDVTKIIFPPVLGTMMATGGDGQATATPAVWLNTYHTIWAIALDSNGLPDVSRNRTLTLPGGAAALTCLTYDDGTRLGAGASSNGPASTASRIWFADTAGNLWSLNASLQAVDNTPYITAPQTLIFTAPILYKDPSGGVTVLYGLYAVSGNPNPPPPSLYGYDPASGRHAAVPTGVTYIWNLSQGVSNGVVFAAGGGAPINGDQVSQVFGIRVDALPQALRDFIIESQMMQDPDPSASLRASSLDADNPIPPSRARYQTHLTVVDDQKKPIAHEAVKVWAEQPMTIQVDGVAYEVGPGDAQFATVKTGVDGALVITSGYAKPDGSDVPDLYVPALRVWAGFMDPYERIVVNPDHEFHGRVSTAHAIDSDADPDKVNLTTATSYAAVKGAAPTPLFTSAETSAGQPQNCATAIEQMKSGVGFGSGGAANSAATLFSRLMLHAGGRQSAQRAIRSKAFVGLATTAPPPKYTAYNDLAGMGYFPANVPAQRLTTVQQPTGLIFIQSQGQPSTAAVLHVVHHTDAQAALDALPPPSVNPPWETALRGQSVHGGLAVRGTHNIFTDFWNWLKGVAAAITHIIVTVADEIMVGIRLIVDGVEQIFKAIVKVVDDIASAIGSFFKMLVKLIEDVIAALSVVFHFGEIMWTHRWLVQQFNTQISAMAATIKANVIPAVDGFFKQGEDTIKSLFNQLRADLGQSDQISNLKGAGATPHTLFNTGANNSDPSHATQCGWGMQKMKSGLPSASTGTLQVAAATADPLADFFTTFVARLNDDNDLGQSLNQLKADFGKLFTAGSISQFFTTLLTTLLDILEVLLVGALAIANAFVDGILALIDDAIAAVLAVLNAEIEIPVITWLYQTLFGEPLTLLNLATLVAAIPVTIIIRVAEGQYPSQLLPSSTVAGTRVSTITSANGIAAASPIVQKVLACFNAMFTFVIGMCSALSDIGGEGGAVLTSVAGKLSLGLGLVLTAMSTPSIGSDNPSGADWAMFGIGVAWALAGVLSLEKFKLADANPTVGTWCSTLMSTMFLVAGIINFVGANDHGPVANAGFSAVVIGSVPAILGPIKLLPEPAPLGVAVLDVAGGLGAAISILFNAFLPQAVAPGPHRLYVPHFPAQNAFEPYSTRFKLSESIARHD